jgi:hypothetical protein
VAYSAADVAYVKVFLRRGDGDEASLDRFYLVDGLIAIENLRMNTSYAVRLEAYTSEDVRIDANADDAPGPDANLEGCDTSFKTTGVETLDLTATSTPFRVKLLDQVYSGQASGAIDVTPGGFVGPSTGAVLVTPTPND